MKLEQIMKLSQRDIEKMTRRELARAVSDLRSVTRKRIERLERDEVYSPAYQNIMASGGIPTVKGMDIIALRNEFKRYKKFIGLKTSTVKGAKNYEKVITTRFKEMTGREFTRDMKPLFGLLDELRDEGTVTRANYKNALNYMVDYIDENPDATDNEIIQNARQEVQNEYEQSARGFYASDRF